MGGSVAIEGVMAGELPEAWRRRVMRLIAAAIEHKLAIVTSNTKHFRSVKTLEIEAFKPRQMNKACSNGHGASRFGLTFVRGARGGFS